MPINGQSLYINEVENSGAISGPYYIGGILGRVQDSNQVYISNAKNKKTGMISDSFNGGGGGTGGIVGHLDGGSLCVINDSGNEATIQQETDCTGGLVGETADTKEIFISQSYNEGDVIYTGSAYVQYGGLVGYTSGGNRIAIKNSYNTGNIIGFPKNYNGGLIGKSSSSLTQIEYSYNTGKIDACLGSGGLIGNVSKELYVNRCYNSGLIKEPSMIYKVDYYSGGLIGYGYGSRGEIRNSNNYATIMLMNREVSNYYAGGIIGESTSNLNINGCTNFGTIQTIDINERINLCWRYFGQGGRKYFRMFKPRKYFYYKFVTCSIFWRNNWNWW